ncbi:survival protein sure-like phosphatase/nucleotidase [Epithele typhae]|uniref:survival protein sure-like phosphatase/nucleotidase n=1 Tax=Epithele typhae TaxID=378194 RepID=UPI002007D617|nr:survival protein sure-like phosphatase/nucleotidase [Epithele typhae]KAH9944401.1 survival protein sure-like phosphatase/nucleotidase [Epithele typhae]
MSAHQPKPRSPYIYGLYRHLTEDLGWDVKVVVPSTQKSWIGGAYHIKDIINGRYYYPRVPDGLGETSEKSRSLKEGETAEWILLDGTPATCANIGLHNLHHGEIDLLTRAIALSYGTVARPTPPEYFEPAHKLGARIVAHLWAHWARESGPAAEPVDLYNVNIPMVPGLLAPEGLPVCWARFWRNSYGRLFQPIPGAAARTTADAPAAVPEGAQGGIADEAGEGGAEVGGGLVFKFAPDIMELINPAAASLPIGSDGWVIRKGWCSVTPMRASFAEPVEWDVQSEEEFEGKIWKSFL